MENESRTPGATRLVGLVTLLGLLLVPSMVHTQVLPGPPPLPACVFSGGFERAGLVRVEPGCHCGQSNRTGREVRLTHQGSSTLPAFANRATVFLNGWRFKYLDVDHHVGRLDTRIERIRLDGQTLRWDASGALTDDDFDDGYDWCYFYTVIAWNSGAIDAVVDHADGATANHVVQLGNATALVALPSYVQNPAFSGKSGASILPRGFSLGWGQDSTGDPPDHKLLQIAYNMTHGERFVERGKTYGALPSPALPTSADRVDGRFVSWETHAILKDNDRARTYRFDERFSALVGNDVSVVVPPFTIRPREDTEFGEGCILPSGSAQVTSEERVIDNIPFDTAIPVLAGWELWYPCDDENVTEIGVWLSDVRYEKGATDPVGRLRYTVSSVLRDENSKPRSLVRHRVHILGLQGRGLVVPPIGPLAPPR